MKAMHLHTPGTVTARLGLFSLVAVLLFAIACGGGSGDKISDSEATDAANNYLATTLGLFTGSTAPEDFINQYAPECREGVDASALSFVSAFMQGLAPELKDLKIEAVDAGPLDIKHTDDGALVTPKDPNALRIKVDGEFQSAADFFGPAGFSPQDANSSADPLHLVQRDGKIYLANCQELQDLAGGLTGS